LFKTHESKTERLIIIHKITHDEDRYLGYTFHYNNLQMIGISQQELTHDKGHTPRGSSVCRAACLSLVKGRDIFPW